MGIPIVAGREFTDADSGRGVAIVNESIAKRYFGGRNAVGRHLGSSAPDKEIVAVVRDAHTQSLHDPPVPMVYFPITADKNLFQTALTNLDVRVEGDGKAAVAAVRDAIKRAEPGLLLGDVGVMSRRLSRDLGRERIVTYLVFSFGALTLLLASMGLYGVLTYGVARRTQEIGVRMALGAARSEVMKGVLGQSARLAIAGISIGLLTAAVGGRYLSDMLYGVSPLDPTTVVAVPVAILLVTMLASYAPARRATRVDPLIALRYE